MKYDRIHPRILRESSHIIDGLNNLPNSWVFGEVAADEKLADIVPIYKKGMRNYRSVHLTSVSGKVMEKIILGDIERQLKNK